MSRFRIIPVLDIMNGIAVHANKGLRNEYQPIHMKFSQSSQPQDLMDIFSQKFQFTEAYIADLDSIIREKPNIELLHSVIQNTHIKIMLDAGIRNLYDVIQFKNLGLNKLILATETIDSFDVIEDAITEVGKEKIVVSIDMKEQHLVSESQEMAQMDIKSIIKNVIKRGITEIILLDLAKIGSLSGGSGSDYQTLRTQFPSIEFIIGGGIKDMNDIRMLDQQKFNGCLIATALHKGIITPQKVADFYEGG
jgi:phosphoribosylformimino-5-aminoimidazole carboxamide ribotide isomerase